MNDGRHLRPPGCGGPLCRSGAFVVLASQMFLQSSDCHGNSTRVMAQRGLQIPGLYKFGDKLLRGFRKGRLNDFAHVVRSIEVGNQTAKERSAASSTTCL